MPDIKTVRSQIVKYRRASGALRSGQSIEVDGVLFLPSLQEGDTEGDLASCERMLSRLNVQLKAARDQALRKGLEINTADGVKHTRLVHGAPALALSLSLDESDVARIVASGANGCVSKRDVRTYARAKESGTLYGYFRKALIRGGVAPDADNLDELVEKALAVTPVEPEEEVEIVAEEKPRALKDMGKEQLQGECESRGLKTTGTKKTLLKSIRDFDKSEQAESVEGDEPEESEEPKNINPLA